MTTVIMMLVYIIFMIVACMLDSCSCYYTTGHVNININTIIKPLLSPLFAAVATASTASSIPSAKKKIYKDFTVTARSNTTKYGLDNGNIPSLLSKEIDSFQSFMIDFGNPLSQEPPIRTTTSDVYIRHCKLFLGWYIDNHQSEITDLNRLSFNDIFPNKNKESSMLIFRFIKWMRTSRKISTSYEANLMRGLIKLVKFRFASESNSDPAYGGKSYEDIPVIKEMRKIHREANLHQKLSPRVSDEKMKWITWSDYLSVIKQVKVELDDMLLNHEHMDDAPVYMDGTQVVVDKTIAAKKRKVATAYQKFLVLSFFSCIPDRQRTFRELEIGKTFIKQDDTSDPANGYEYSYKYVIKHGPSDYKTGKCYGERPPLVLANYLTKYIDNYISQWRSVLNPTCNNLFVQQTTGNALTGDCIYKIVTRACYKYTGKKTNPHLLRDIIVTHVRDTAASERELEALALYMGHSINMQRTSYDRRTLSQKVNPAVSLLHALSNINA